MVEDFTKTFQKIMPELNNINFGIILISIYFLLEFGSFQGLFPVIRATKIPFIISVSSVLYATYLILSGNINFNSKTTRYFGCFTIFMISYSLLATKFSVTKIETIKLCILYFSNYLIVIHSVKNESQFILLLDIWLFSVLFSCFHAIMQGGLIWGNRWLKDENHISLVAAMAFPFALMLFVVHKSKIKKMYYALCLFGYATANIIAHSRGGALSLGLGLFFCFVVMKHKIRNFIVIIVIVIVGLRCAPTYFFEEMATLQQGTQESTANDRIYLWDIAIKMFYDHPLIGVGPGNYPFYFYFYERGERYKIGATRVAHSTPIQFLAETGLVGLLFFLSFQIPLYRNWITIVKAQKEFFHAYFILITHACFISQIAFHFGSIFLSLMPYPFYWCLILFSESWKNICKIRIFEER